MRQIPSQRGAFTLLEMILSLSVLATVMTMVATMWAQADAWSGQNGAHHEAMRLQRTIAFMHDQWDDRRSTVALVDEDTDEADEASRDPGIRATPEVLSFVTATPILFPDAPIVIAQYTIERTYDESLGRSTGSRLIYREQEIANLAGDATLDPDAVEYVLLEDCTGLAFERFGPPIVDEGESAEEGVTPSEQPPSEWRLFDEPYTKPIPAVRITGAHEGEPFSCVFVIEALR